MKSFHKLTDLLVFFWAIGWIYAGSAIGADDTKTIAPLSFVVSAPDDDAGAVLSDDAEEEEFEYEQDLYDQTISTSSFGSIDLHIQDQDVLKVLQMLAIQSQRNILPSPSVSGNISAALYDVDFYEALDAVLHTNGYGYLEEGNFIKIYTASELVELEQRNRKLATKVVRLDYLNAADAAKFLETLISAGGGSITVNGPVEEGFEPSIAAGGENSFAWPATLLIRDYPEVVQEMLEVIKILDVQPKQVQIEATILEAKITEDNAWGVDLSVVGNFDMGLFTNPLGVVDQLLSGAIPTEDDGGFKAVNGNGAISQSTVGNVTDGASGVKFGYIGSHVSVFVRALDKVTDTTVLATPKLVVLNRQRGKLLSGQKLGYISTTATETSTTQTVEFLEVGTELIVRPFINNDGFIRLELRPELSEGSVRSTEGFVIPDESVNELFANILVPNGKTIVLGGLFKEDTTVSRHDVPGLSDLPIVDPLFKGQDDLVQRSEVIFMIKPTILHNESLIKIGERIEEDVHLASIGVREGLLPWSRTALTTSHLRDAYKHLAEGDNNRALWSAKLALKLDPNIVEALRIKNGLTGEKMNQPSSSILKRAIDEFIDAQIDAGVDTHTPDTTDAHASNDPADAPDHHNVAQTDSDKKFDPAANLIDTPQVDVGATVIFAKDELGVVTEPKPAPVDDESKEAAALTTTPGVLPLRTQTSAKAADVDELKGPVSQASPQGHVFWKWTNQEVLTALVAWRETPRDGGNQTVHCAR